MMGSSKRKSGAQSCGEAAKMTAEVFPSKKRNKAVVSVCTSSLSVDMILEVLLRLPIKSIVRFRAVCRAWDTLFSSKDFCSLHMVRSKVVPPAQKLLVVSPTARLNSTGMYSCSPSGSRANLLFTFDDASRNSMEVVTPSPCYGLTLLYDAAMPAYYVCNAATRAITRLPRCPDPEHISTAGLGFDARNREYKVVRLINEECSDKDLNRCEVYTPGADGWRPAAGGVPFSLFEFVSSAVINAHMDRVPPVFADGFLHWMINPYHVARRPSAAIISFSVKDETFRCVRSPPFWTSKVHLRPDPKSEGEHLVKMDNQLCMVRDLRNRIRLASTMEIWKLLDYSPGEWSLNHRIDLSDLYGHVARYLRDPQVVRVIGTIDSCRSRKKIVIASSKHIILDQFEKKLHTYDPSCKALETIFSIRETHTSVIHCRPGSRFGLFEESLFPVHKTDG